MDAETCEITASRTKRKRPSDEEDLKDNFSKLGEVTEVNIKTDPTTEGSQSFAFANRDSVDNVLHSGPQTIKGKQVEAKRAKVSTTPEPGIKRIYVASIEYDMSEADIHNYFEQYGKVECVDFPLNQPENQKRKFCCVTFEDEMIVDEVCKQHKQKMGNKNWDIIKATTIVDPRTDYNIIMDRFCDRHQNSSRKKIKSIIDDLKRLIPTEYYVSFNYKTTYKHDFSKISINFPCEIIEIACSVVNGRTCDIVGKFHSYIKPKLNPHLTTFCTVFTGITQDTIKQAQGFRAVFKRLEEWITNLAKNGNIITVTDKSDFLEVVCLQYLINNISSDMFLDIIDVKEYVEKNFGILKEGRLSEMLGKFDHECWGNLKECVNYAFNLSRLVMLILKKDETLWWNTKKLDPEDKKYLESELREYLRKKEKLERAKIQEINKKIYIEDAKAILERQMDIDPDLVATEDTLIEQKSKKECVEHKLPACYRTKQILKKTKKYQIKKWKKNLRRMTYHLNVDLSYINYID